MTTYAKSFHGARKAIAEAIPESDIKRAIKQYLEWKGWYVRDLSQRVKVEGDLSGMPDLCCMKAGVTFWIETKRAKGKLRDSQVAFAEDMQHCVCDTIQYAVIRDIDTLMELIP